MKVCDKEKFSYQSWTGTRPDTNPLTGQKARELMQKVSELVSVVDLLKVPTKWEIERVSGYVEGLFSFAKFSVGEKVEMAETYPVSKEDSWGWMNCRHLLTVGGKATVEEVDWSNGRFVYLITFDEKSYINSEGYIIKSQSGTSLSLSEKWLKKRSYA
jgi:hypothetical protein